MPVNKDGLLKSNTAVLIKGKTSINSLVGKGSKIHVDYFDEAMVVVSSESLTVHKHSKHQFLQTLLKVPYL